MDGVENPCSSEQYGVGFPSLGITERSIPAHLSMLNEKECFSSHLSLGWHGFSSLRWEDYYTLNGYSGYGKQLQFSKI